MTDDKAGPELDALISELMGDERCPRHKSYGECFHGQFGREYSTDREAALEIQAEMYRRGFAMAVRSPLPGRDIQEWTLWLVEFWKPTIDDAYLKVDAHAPTLPLAICRAALKTKGQIP